MCFNFCLEIKASLQVKRALGASVSYSLAGITCLISLRNFM
jgi:hypothetical protein